MSSFRWLLVLFWASAKMWCERVSKHRRIRIERITVNFRCPSTSHRVGFYEISGVHCTPISHIVHSLNVWEDEPVCTNIIDIIQPPKLFRCSGVIMFWNRQLEWSNGILQHCVPDRSNEVFLKLAIFIRDGRGGGIKSKCSFYWI